MSTRKSARSLRWRFTFSLVLVETLTAVVLVATVTLFALVVVAQQRTQSIKEVSRVIAAGVLPLVADQQTSGVQDQLDSILEASELHYLTGVRVTGSDGKTLASIGALPAPSADQRLPLAELLAPRIIREPIAVSGITVAYAEVAIAPIPVTDLLRLPLLSGAIVALSVVLVSAPWYAWVFARSYLEPVQDLERSARRLADGHYEQPMPADALGELGDLQATFSAMARSLKDREEQLLETYDALAQAYDLLAESKQQVEQMAALKADFLAVAAHEIRNPLATLTLYAELLESGQIADLDDAVADAVHTISDATARLGRMASDLMDVALLERGTLPMRLSRIWLDEIVLEAARESRAIGDSRGTSVRLEGEVPELIVAGDAVRLRQVVDNLISNAIKYSPAKGEVLLRTRASGGWAEIEVEDQGPGIPESERSRAFAPFTRLDTAENRDADSRGLGLGLAISQRIAEAHGGEMTVRFVKGRTGSIFTMRTMPSRFSGRQALKSL